MVLDYLSILFYTNSSIYSSTLAYSVCNVNFNSAIILTLYGQIYGIWQRGHCYKWQQILQENNRSKILFHIETIQGG